MSGDIRSTRDFKSAKIWIMFLFYVLSFFKKGDTIQGGTLFKGGHYLRKYGISFSYDHGLIETTEQTDIWSFMHFVPDFGYWLLS